MTKTNRLEVMERVEKFLSDLVDCHDLTEPASDGGISVGMVFQHDAKWLRTMLARHRIETNTRIDTDACAHCGASGWKKIVNEKGSDKVHPYRIRCDECGVSTAWHGDFKAADAAWRRRPTPQSITPPEGGELVELIYDLRKMGKGQRDGCHYQGTAIPEGFKFTAERAADYLAALSTPEASDTKGLVDALEKVDQFITQYREPWGSWKTPWWEGEVSDDAAFTDDNAIMHCANIVRKALAQHRGSTL